MSDNTLRDALESIRQYGSDTLSGRSDGPDNREWYRAGVAEMTKRARLALTTNQAAEAAPVAVEAPKAVGTLRITQWPTGREWHFEPIEDLRVLPVGEHPVSIATPATSPLAGVVQPLLDELEWACFSDGNIGAKERRRAARTAVYAALGIKEAK